MDELRERERSLPPAPICEAARRVDLREQSQSRRYRGGSERRRGQPGPESPRGRSSSQAYWMYV